MLFSIIDIIKYQIVLLLSFDRKPEHILKFIFQKKLHFYSKVCNLMHMHLHEKYLIFLKLFTFYFQVETSYTMTCNSKDIS